ncbi:MAG: hypothetical protein ABSF44_11955 [Candidatus Bathyarchaeia archaeon]|jgi:hypothetical protein
MVTKIRIDPGNCMMKAVVTVQKQSNERQNPRMEVDVCLESECKNLDVFKMKFKTASMRTYPDMMKETIPHCICPIPLGVVKACEMEMGIGLKKNLTYEVVKE